MLLYVSIALSAIVAAVWYWTYTGESDELIDRIERENEEYELKKRMRNK